MAHINENYLKLAAGYLFPEIARRVNVYADANPRADVIRLGIGDVVKGIPRPIVDAMKNAMEEIRCFQILKEFGDMKLQMVHLHNSLQFNNNK